MDEVNREQEPGIREPSTEGLPEFSLVLGGPLFQLFRRVHLSGDELELLHRRMLFVALLAWLPLLIASSIESRIFDRGITLSFVRDIETHVRFLIALPALVLGEVVVHPAIRNAVHRFVDRGIVQAKDFSKYQAAVRSAWRAQNSVSLELILLALVYTLGPWIWRSQFALHMPSWYATTHIQRLHLSLTGYWYTFVSIPIFQFLLLRWYMRLVLWFRLLWQISRLDLRLSAAHPDHAGGIGFLAMTSYTFGPILFAQGALTAGRFAGRILHEGSSLLSLKMEAISYVSCFVLLILAPLLMFTPKLLLAKRRGRAEYGLLASRYVTRFENKWIRSSQHGDELLGTSDLQSLADLANSYSNVRSMRIVPFAIENVVELAIVTAAPLLPLVLTVVSLEELLRFIVRALFQ